MSDTMTILSETSGKTMTKTHTSSGPIPYDNGTWFDFMELDLAGIEDVFNALNTLKVFKSVCVIRGIGIDKDNARRTNDNTQSASHHWMMIDFDNVEITVTHDETTISDAVIATYLPPEFQDASYVWQHSSSAGMSGWNTVSGHAFFWLSTKQDDRTLHHWAKEWNSKLGIPHPVNLGAFKNVIDPSLYQRIQIHYVASPIFVGVTDPVKARVFLRHKPNDVVNFTYIAPPQQTITQLAYIPQDTEVEQALALIRNVYVAPGYEDWRKITYAVAKTAGATEAIAIMSGFWPEQKRGEYQKLLKGFDPAKSPGFGTLIKLARESNPTFLRDKLALRIAELKANSEPDAEDIENLTESLFLDEPVSTWKWQRVQSGLSYHYVEGECGEGKTEWMLHRITNSPGRYVIALPKIVLIQELRERLDKIDGHLQSTVDYQFKTIHSKRGTTLRDDEDYEEGDNGRETVTRQLADYKAEIDRAKARNVVIFITHAALFQTDWSGWSDFELFVDEIPEVYINYTEDFRNSFYFLERYVVAAHTEQNYYRLGLTKAGREKFEEGGHFDTVETAIQGLVEAINNRNVEVYAHKESWDSRGSSRVAFIRLVNPNFLSAFSSVTILGDKFTESLMALVWARTHDVRWIAHPDWRPYQKRIVPLSKRVHLHYFSESDGAGKERRASATLFSDQKLEILKAVRDWLPSNASGQVLVTTNSRHSGLFEVPVSGYRDVTTVDGMERQYFSISPKLPWVQPKAHGLNVYRNMRNAAWMAAMRPGAHEIAFLSAALQVTEEEVIRWREYNAMYQFLMRIKLRVYDQNDECHVYVWDKQQADYLVDRFGGCLSLDKHSDIKGIEARRVGRTPKGENGRAMTGAERVRAKRERDRLANLSRASESNTEVADRLTRIIENQTGKSMAENAQRLGLTGNK